MIGVLMLVAESINGFAVVARALHALGVRQIYGVIGIPVTELASAAQVRLLLPFHFVPQFYFFCNINWVFVLNLIHCRCSRHMPAGFLWNTAFWNELFWNWKLSPYSGFGGKGPAPLSGCSVSAFHRLSASDSGACYLLASSPALLLLILFAKHLHS